jgi:hypothetical protein
MAEQPHHASRENHHAENVERTLKELQKRVAEQEELLNQVRPEKRWGIPTVSAL